MNPLMPERAAEGSADEAIARVLRAEREAQSAIAHTRAEAGKVAEAARAEARAVAERAERRIRRVASAFERDLTRRLAEIDAESTLMTQAHTLTTDEIAALERAVRRLAAELTGCAA
jgi:F-type H+-transporting ATPase subunit b